VGIPFLIGQPLILHQPIGQPGSENSDNLVGGHRFFLSNILNWKTVHYLLQNGALSYLPLHDHANNGVVSQCKRAVALLCNQDFKMSGLAHMPGRSLRLLPISQVFQYY
jgi:hypothetical protein